MARAPAATKQVAGQARGLGILRKTGQYRQCQNLVPESSLKQAQAQKQAIGCFGCGCSIECSSPVVTVYRMTAETLARPKPSVATANVESALRMLDPYPNVFRRLGQYWIIKYDNELVIMQSKNGLSYIARLLVDPGRKVPAAFLLAAEMGIDPRIPVGSLGPVLDDDALAAYRKIYHEITHDLEVATKDNDHARLAELEKQKEAFSAEIEKATGLGGRRREKSDPDRVRKNVSNAATRAIDAVASDHERLGKHLRNSITSGSAFSYDPERDPLWLV